MENAPGAPRAKSLTLLLQILAETRGKMVLRLATPIPAYLLVKFKTLFEIYGNAPGASLPNFLTFP